MNDRVDPKDGGVALPGGVPLEAASPSPSVDPRDAGTITATVKAAGRTPEFTASTKAAMDIFLATIRQGEAMNGQHSMRHNARSLAMETLVSDRRGRGS